MGTLIWIRATPLSTERTVFNQVAQPSYSPKCRLPGGFINSNYNVFSMRKALVTLTDNEPDDRLLDAAKRYATGTDTELIVCRFIDEERYQSKLQRSAESGTDLPSMNEIEKTAHAEATAIAKQVFGDEVSYSVQALIGDLRDDVLQIADEKDCDHLFITGRKRSPTGKALFGDAAQSIILGFDGPVTIVTRSHKGNNNRHQSG